ncbi:unnamed protein product [Sphacelaria rigidula]
MNEVAVAFSFPSGVEASAFGDFCLCGVLLESSLHGHLAFPLLSLFFFPPGCDGFFCGASDVVRACVKALEERTWLCRLAALLPVFVMRFIYRKLAFCLAVIWDLIFITTAKTRNSEHSMYHTESLNVKMDILVRRKGDTAVWGC